MGTESNDMGTAKNNDDATSLVAAAVRGLMVFLVPMAGIVGAYYSTRAAIESDIRALRQDLLYHTRSTESDIKQLKESIASLRGELDRHDSLGIDGVPHPLGTQVVLDKIETRLDRLESKVMP